MSLESASTAVKVQMSPSPGRTARRCFAPTNARISSASTQP
jgi:hypothetical protein